MSYLIFQPNFFIFSNLLQLFPQYKKRNKVITEKRNNIVYSHKENSVFLFVIPKFIFFFGHIFSCVIIWSVCMLLNHFWFLGGLLGFPISVKESLFTILLLLLQGAGRKNLKSFAKMNYFWNLYNKITFFGFQTFCMFLKISLWTCQLNVADECAFSSVAV